MKRNTTVAAILLGSFAASAAQIEAGGPSQVTVKLASVRGSGASGTATMTQDGPKLTIVVKMTSGGMSGPQAAHIHRGTCPNPDPKPVYPLEPVVKGTSTTTLESTSLDALESENYTISIHKSATDKKNPIACGDIRSPNRSGASRP